MYFTYSRERYVQRMDSRPTVNSTGVAFRPFQCSTYMYSSKPLLVVARFSRQGTAHKLNLLHCACRVFYRHAMREYMSTFPSIEIFQKNIALWITTCIHDKSTNG